MLKKRSMIKEMQIRMGVNCGVIIGLFRIPLLHMGEVMNQKEYFNRLMIATMLLSTIGYIVVSNIAMGNVEVIASTDPGDYGIIAIIFYPPLYYCIKKCTDLEHRMQREWQE